MTKDSGDSWQPVKGAGPDRLRLLGTLLKMRRADLGYRRMPAFIRDRDINIRMIGDIEHGRRDTFESPSLKNAARAYEVTYDSMLAVVWSGAGELVPAEPAPAGVSAHILPPAPMDDAGRENAVRPYATALWDQLLRLAGQGITDPSGAILGLPPGDAKVWDGSAGAMSLADRAWLVADIQRRRDARTADSRNGTATA